MCGIVGYSGSRPVVEVLLKGMKRLEYRGYDSSGVALSGPTGKITVIKSSGKISNVEKMIWDFPGGATFPISGMGHTRWATHGKPNAVNAHPHHVNEVALVHNGIIENYAELRKSLLDRGHAPRSETDTELFGFMLQEALDQGLCLSDAVATKFHSLSGANSFLVMSSREPGVLIGVRNGSPLVFGNDPLGGVVIASDAQPIMDYSHDVTFLEHGEMAVIRGNQAEISSVKSRKIQHRSHKRLDRISSTSEMGGYAHHMLKEIMEQPDALTKTLEGLTQRGPGGDRTKSARQQISSAKKIDLIACGTSLHAAMLGKHWIERFGAISCSVYPASEYRYRNWVRIPSLLVLAISQSGETADTLAVIEDCGDRLIDTLSISNVENSSLSRVSNQMLYTRAGPEIGVAATKTFMTQLLVLSHLAFGLKEGAVLPDPLEKLPDQLALALKDPERLRSEIRKIALKIHSCRSFLFIGRGPSYPVALEAALKLKEIAYRHAEGYPAGELKHGPIALLDNRVAVIAICPQDPWQKKMRSNMEEVKARGAQLIGIGEDSDYDLMSICDEWIGLPLSEISSHHSPFFTSLAVQLLSYELAVLAGTEIDMPRNLAKSVTVE